MALYAFDGTLNTDDPTDKKGDTNVVKFRDAYDGQAFFENGVGMRFGLAGKFFGGTFGAGGEARVDSAYDNLKTAYHAGDQFIDIVGFSRGAALALDFANRINKRGVEAPDGSLVIKSPPIRFLGLWDTVGSFGLPLNFIIPFHRINLGKNLKVPPNVEHCYHALALNERRQAFRPTRVNKKGKLANVHEVWFKGTHSDVGGSINLNLSSIALTWMYRKAEECGVRFKEGALEAAEEQHNASVAPSKKSIDPIENRLRKILPTDVVHASAVTPEALARTDDKLKELLPTLRTEAA